MNMNRLSPCTRTYRNTGIILAAISVALCILFGLPLKVGAAAPGIYDLNANITGKDWAETNQPLPAQTIEVTQPASDTQPISIECIVERDPSLFSTDPPDPVFGSDIAVGKRSWTEVSGKIIETGSLTDNKDWTSVLLPWGTYTEATQTINLGSSQSIVHLSYVASDANWSWKADVLASQDGVTYKTIPSLRNIDMHQKWGRNNIDVPVPFTCRFLRLRYHDSGASVNAISMPGTLSVYTGAKPGQNSFPETGSVVYRTTQKLKVDTTGSATATVVDKKPMSAGAYFIVVRVNDGARSQLLYKHVFVMPAPMPRVNGDSRFGLNTSDYKLAPINRRLGIGWARFENMKWPMISPAPGVYNYLGNPPWNLNYDQIIKAYRLQGISVLPFLMQTPEYATSAPATVTANREGYPPKDFSKMSEFVFQTVARYGSKAHPAAELNTADKISGLNEISDYEIWNEPNFHDPGWSSWVGTDTQFYTMFRAAAIAVKRADPHAKVTNGGLGGMDLDTVGALITPYPDGKRPLDFVDILNVHYYSARVAPEIAVVDANATRKDSPLKSETYEKSLHRLVSWRNHVKPTMPIWLTETGYDTAGPWGTDETTQAARLPRVIMTALAAGIDKVFVYRETGSSPSLFSAAGIMRNDGSLRPSWFTYATLIRQLDGVQRGASRLPTTNPNVRLYVWKRNKQTILTAWCIRGTENIGLKLGRATITDAFGSTETNANVNSLHLSTFPIYVVNISNLKSIAALEIAANK